jgi:hypothetical protein
MQQDDDTKIPTHLVTDASDRVLLGGGPRRGAPRACRQEAD